MRRVAIFRGPRALVLAVCVALATAGVASATVVERGHYSGTYEFSFDDCGFWLDGEGAFSGHVRIRADKGGQAFFANDNFEFREVITNRVTGSGSSCVGTASSTRRRPRTSPGTSTSSSRSRRASRS